MNQKYSTLFYNRDSKGRRIYQLIAPCDQHSTLKQAHKWGQTLTPGLHDGYKIVKK